MQKTPLMLIPGLLCNESVWRHQIENLKDVADVSVIMTTREDTPDKMVEALLLQAPPQFALAGHSMGGWLCLEIMRRAPERVLKLCLLNTSARSDTPEKLAKRIEMIESVGRGEFLTIAQKLAEVFVLNKSIEPEVLKMFHQVGEAPFICQEKSMMLRKSCVPILSKIAVQTCVIHAEEDRNFTMEEHEELASKIPDAHLKIVPNSGHMSPMEAPGAVTALLREWLHK